MFDALLAQVEPNKDALSARLRAPLEEQFAREVEQASFFDHRFTSTFSYQNFSTSVKRFGFGGLTHLNDKHLRACFVDADPIDQKEKMTDSRALYFKEPFQECVDDNNSDGVPVVYLLRLAILLCEHTCQAGQLLEMWLLVNPSLEETICADNFYSLVETFVQIAVSRTCSRIESLGKLTDATSDAQRTISLRYLAMAKGMKNEFLDDFKNGLPSELSFIQFAKVAQKVCMNSSQLRMAITKTPEVRTSQAVAISQVSTIIISYLTQVEQVGKAQLICLKWYRKFVPQVMRKIRLNFTPWQKRRFRLVFEEVGSEGPLYLAHVTDRAATDMREKCGRTCYISAGSADQYRQFSWTIDRDGILKATNDSQVCLAAHRTFVNDTLAKDGTFVISTIYKGHENQWRLERVGDLDRQRYLLVMANSKCIKDHVNHVGWAMTAEVPQTGCPSNAVVIRDETSRYVYIKRPCEQRRTLSRLPVWRLELCPE